MFLVALVGVGMVGPSRPDCCHVEKNTSTSLVVSVFGCRAEDTGWMAYALPMPRVFER